MAEINIYGINLSNGQYGLLGSGDTPVDSNSTSFSGATGIQGITGFLGNTGIEGTQGATGLLGSYTGIIGRTGIRLDWRGETGTQGVTGIIGATGPLNTTTGITGRTGIQGITGIQGVASSYSSISGATTLAAEVSPLPQVIGVNTTGGPFTVTLPLSSSIPGSKQYIIQDEGGLAGTNNLTIATSGSDVINGAANYIMNTNYEGVDIYNTGTAFFVLVAAKMGATGIQTGATGIIGISPQGETGIQGATGV